MSIFYKIRRWYCEKTTRYCYNIVAHKANKSGYIYKEGYRSYDYVVDLIPIESITYHNVLRALYKTDVIDTLYKTEYQLKKYTSGGGIR